MGFLITISFSVLILSVFDVYCETYPECEGVELQSFVADPKDCQGYIYCDGDESMNSKCGADERFNAQEGICDNKDNVECSTDTTAAEPVTVPSPATTPRPATSLSSNVPDTSSSPTKAKQTTTLAPSSGPDTSSSPTTSADEICSESLDPNQLVYLPNPNSCSSFYVCYKGASHVVECPQDFMFNSVKATCVYPHLSDCKVGVTTTPNPRDLCAGKASGYFEYARNCHFYYRCLNGYLTIQECPVGFGWDVEKKMCSTTATCIKST